MKTFGFNLLPEKPKELVVKEESRDKGSVYTALLPLFGVLLWLGLLLFNVLVVNHVKATWQTAVDQKTSTIKSQFSTVLNQHGELVIKTSSLATIIIKDIKPENVFLLTEKLFPAPEAGVIITGYGRENDGSFDVTITTPDYAKIAQITRRFSDYTGIRTVNLRSSSLDVKHNSVQSTINFFFTDKGIVTSGNTTQ